MHLSDRHPRLSASDLAARFVPPDRFGGVRFSTYVPDARHPSQREAKRELERFARSVAAVEDRTRSRSWRRGRRASATERPGRYLDGGFGVGKTHLLASLWHAVDGAKAYLTFEELAAFIGFVGMSVAIETFAGHRLLAIDEFELDDVANTRMAVTFLRAAVEQGTHIAATSNAVPDRLGEGRFNAEDFQREISAIAAHFDVLRIDGPDYRAAQHPADLPPLTPGDVESLLDLLPAAAVDDFDAVLAHLGTVHPVQYGALVRDLDLVVVQGLRPIENQNAALLFVQLIDEIYDAGIAFAGTGCAIAELFPDSYRHGGYRKKYGRCESRLVSLLGEAHARAGAAPRPSAGTA